MDVLVIGKSQIDQSHDVNDRQRVAAIVSQAALTHADAVGARLDEELVPVADAGDDGASLLRRLGETLQRSMELVAADQAHEAEKADDGQVRRELEAAVEGLYCEVVDLRAGLGGGERGCSHRAKPGFRAPRRASRSRLAGWRRRQKKLPELASVPATRARAGGERPRDPG